jgi:hypothetical protein
MPAKAGTSEEEVLVGFGETVLVLVLRSTFVVIFNFSTAGPE